MVLADSSPCVEAERKRRAGDRRHNQQDQGQIGHFFWNKIPRILGRKLFHLIRSLIKTKPFQRIKVFKKGRNA